MKQKTNNKFNQFRNGYFLGCGAGLISALIFLLYKGLEDSVLFALGTTGIALIIIGGILNLKNEKTK